MNESTSTSAEKELIKEQNYLNLIPQIEALIKRENDLIANLANISAILKMDLNCWWVGFYIVKNDWLVLGPFQGPVACSRIEFGKGVCGTAWKEKRMINVGDVHDFFGHIACSSHTKSEIVIPVFDKNGEVAMVLDIDSVILNAFDKVDERYLQSITTIITANL